MTAQTVRGRIDGLLAVTCWCERATVLATVGEVAQGRTRSCSHRGCSEGCVRVRPLVTA